MIATPGANLSDTLYSSATDHDFDESWLPGISFDENNEDSILNSSNSSSSSSNTTEQINNKRNMTERIVTPPPLHHNIPCDGIGSSELLATCPSWHEQHRDERNTPDKPGRHIQFASHEFLETSHAPPIIPELNEDLIQSLWWKSPELLQMKRYTRRCMLTPMSDIDKDELLGIDRFSSERIAYKKKSIRFVLLAQHQQSVHNVSDNPSGYIRAVSRRCSHWSRNVSHVIALRIFEELYGDNRTQRLATIPEEAVTGDDLLSSSLSVVKPPANEENENKNTSSSMDECMSNRSNKRKRAQPSTSSKMECEDRRVLRRRTKGDILPH
jgi:hypothetical protein